MNPTTNKSTKRDTLCDGRLTSGLSNRPSHQTLQPLRQHIPAPQKCYPTHALRDSYQIPKTSIKRSDYETRRQPWRSTPAPSGKDPTTHEQSPVAPSHRRDNLPLQWVNYTERSMLGWRPWRKPIGVSATRQAAIGRFSGTVDSRKHLGRCTWRARVARMVAW